MLDLAPRHSQASGCAFEPLVRLLQHKTEASLIHESVHFQFQGHACSAFFSDNWVELDRKYNLEAARMTSHQHHKSFKATFPKVHFLHFSGSAYSMMINRIVYDDSKRSVLRTLHAYKHDTLSALWSEAWLEARHWLQMPIND